MDKIDTFLARYYLIDYDTLVKTAKAEDFDKNDYSRLSKTLKKKLFRSRAKIYLSALADTVEKGHKLEDILDSVKLGIIPYIKKEIEEPTFNVIYEFHILPHHQLLSNHIYVQNIQKLLFLAH